MKSIGVVHMNLESKGGGEAVAMNVIEALQANFDVTLLSLTEPDIPSLNDYFNTDVDAEALDVDIAGVVAPTMNRLLGLRYYVLQNALLSRYARARADELDLLVSTINELGLGPDAVQYVHFPFDWTVSLDNRDQIFHPSIEEESLYERVCTFVADVSRESIQSQRVFTNSQWTAAVFEDAYGTEPEVLHPPVDTGDFRPVPWSEREDGFVTVGRIERSKRIVEMIQIIDGLREGGHDVHLHIVGPTVDEEYLEEVANRAAARSYIELEGELPRDELVDRINTHRYGIHGKQYEHFGMAVAELAAGGTIPFVPSDGGQHAIVHDDERLQYDSVEQAVEKITHVLANRPLQRELRWTPEEIERRFGCARFKKAIRAAVADQLGHQLTEQERAPEESTAKVAAGDR